MKNSTNILWQLIKSMNRSEKLYFERTCKEAMVKNALYKKLYTVIASQKIYNEAEVIKKLSPAITKKNIAFQKHYLHQLLNDCLVNYANRDNVEQEIYRNIQLIRMNRMRGLIHEALALWVKTMNKARTVELFAMSQLLKKEFEKMILFSSVQVRYDDLHQLFRSNIMTYEDYAEMIALRDLYTEVIMLKRKAHFDFDDILNKEVAILVKKLDQRKPGLHSRSFWYRHYTRMCHATLDYLSNHIEGSLELIKDAVADWWKHPGFITSESEHYLELLYMVNYSGVRNGSFDYVLSVFNATVNDLITEDVQVAHFEAVKYLALNKVYNKTGRYHDVAKLIGHMKIKYNKWETLLNAELNRTLCFSLGISCFVLDDYDESLQYIKRGVTYFKDGTREEQFVFAYLFLLLVTFSMNNPKLFEAQYKSTYSYFYKKRKPGRQAGKSVSFSMETTLMQCFHEAFYLNSYKEKREVFKDAIDKLDANMENEAQKQLLGIFNFYGWLMSRILRISYKEYVQRNVAIQPSEKIVLA